VNYIFCDGGLANRLNTLIAGLALKEITGTPWTIAWPRNWACGASFEDLFEPILPVVEYPLSYFKRYSRNYFFLFHENQIDFPEERIRYHEQNDLDELKRIITTGCTTIYFNNVIPEWVDQSLFYTGIKKIRAIEEIHKRVKGFIEKNKINRKTIGIQIRKTDFGSKVNEDMIFELVKNDNARYFICSDSSEVENKFSILPNCVINLKQEYVQKRLKDRDWNELVKDSDGRTYPYNVLRSSASVQEALSDFLILSSTSVKRVSGSTFQNLAHRFSETLACNKIEP
jgi:hypothetical protein